MNSSAFPHLHDFRVAARPILAIDMTALWDRPTTGIQRVTRAITPGLAAEATRRGWDIQLVRHTRRGLESLGHWSSDTSLLQIHTDLDHVAMGVHTRTNITYARIRNVLRRRIRSIRLACRATSDDVIRETWLRRWVPDVVRRYVTSWRRRSLKPAVTADAYLTFAAGILPATLPMGVPPERSVFVLHDLIPIQFPHYYPPQMSVNFHANLHALAVAPSLAKRRIVTASRHVAADICRVFAGISRTAVQVDVVSWGYDKATFFPQPDGSFRHAFGIPDNVPLVVAVSTQDPRKRFADIVSAVNASNSHAIFLGAGSPRREGNAIFLGHVPDELVRRAYSSSDVFVNWSAAEGFGLPTIEALACGARVVVPPDNPTLLEIGGQHVTVADRADVPALRKAIARAGQQPRQIPDLSAFSWQHPTQRFTELLWEEPAGEESPCQSNSRWLGGQQYLHRIAA
jgi:glycosyltransferase involved in cell wall biosynthesis